MSEIESHHFLFVSSRWAMPRLLPVCLVLLMGRTESSAGALPRLTRVRFGWAVDSTSGGGPLGSSTPTSSSLWWLEAHLGLQLVGLLACPRDDLSARCHGTSVLKGAAYVLRDRATSTALGFLASAERGMAAGARAVASYRLPFVVKGW